MTFWGARDRFKAVGTYMQVVTLVGGELAEPEGGARLSKAQKKNARRLERKAAQRAAADVSVASSDVRSRPHAFMHAKVEQQYSYCIEAYHCARLSSSGSWVCRAGREAVFELLVPKGVMHCTAILLCADLPMERRHPGLNGRFRPAGAVGLPGDGVGGGLRGAHSCRGAQWCPRRGARSCQW